MKLKILTGLLGVDNDGTLYHPDGRKLFWLPMSISRHIQRLQHHFAVDMDGNRIRVNV
jgi:hypothetical protein